MHFNLRLCPLKGLVVVERESIDDHRGLFSRLFCAEALRAAGFDTAVAQINYSRTTRRGTVRGLHYQQPPEAEIKYISVLRGEIFDVAVDLRRTSPTFLQWHAEILASRDARSILIPRGFAHGFQALTDDCELLYLHSAAYSSISERAMHVNDPALAISWPLPVGDISNRDASHPFITLDFPGVLP